MFNKKSCNNCGKKITDNYNFCPHCGFPVKENSKKEWGMLGKNDGEREVDDFSNFLSKSLGSGIFNKVLQGTMKMMEKELQKEIKSQKKNPMNMQLFINGKRVDLGAPEEKIEKEKLQKKKIKLPQNNLKDYKKFPKQEPAVTMRRFSDKIVYEIKIPGISSEKEISIVALEQSVEIKAVAQSKSYLKIIPINLPLTNYKVEKGKIILEFGI